MKEDLIELNERIVIIEEELYESKQIQLELLENLKSTEQKLEETMENHEMEYADLEKKYHDKLEFSKQKISEQYDLIGKLEYTQCIYIAHKTDKIDRTLANFINRYPERKRMNIMFLRESEGVYKFG